MNIEKTKSIIKKYWPVIITFLLFTAYMFICIDSMVDESGDAASIWETIKSYYSGNLVSSYVLYKGFASVYPYVWLYKLASLIGLNEFFFIKLYHCILFTYISTIGLPYCIKKITKKDIKPYRVMILSIILFWIWSIYGALTQMMIDLPSLAVFILLVNSMLRISNSRHKVICYVCSGIFAGLCCCFSGQYTLAVLCLFIYLLIITFSKKLLFYKKNILKKFLLIGVFIICLSGVRFTNYYFEENVTNVLREEGEWIPTGSDWLSMAYARQQDVSRVGYGPTIKDKRGYTIFEDYFSNGDNYAPLYETMKVGGFPMTMKDYLRMVSKYPADFALKYVERIFISFSPDKGTFNFWMLLASYTMFFISIFVAIKNVKSIKQFFSPNLLIILSFICSIAAIVVCVVEMRTVMQIQGLVYAVAILSDELWISLKKFGISIREIFVNRSLKIIGKKRMPWAFVVYILFIFVCFCYMGSLYSGGEQMETLLIDFTL